MVYRLVQECCNNIAKHSGATSVNISVSSADGRVRLAVEDNGVGFNVEEALARKDSFGLSGMRERVALLGGRFEVHSYAGNGSVRGISSPRNGKVSLDGKRRSRGTKISITLPVAQEPPAFDLDEPIAAKPIGRTAQRTKLLLARGTLSAARREAEA
jgi:glucose-6-phosphate-specific signal transduction histidine kinase